MTRREFLIAAAATPLAAARRPAWNDERLGLACNLSPEEPKARALLAAAAQAGFRRIQLFPPWAKASTEYMTALPGWVRAAGLEAPVLGSYVNCCQPSNAIMGSREQDFGRAIDFAARVGAHCLTVWSGGYGKDLMTPDPRNFTREAEDNICRFFDRHGAALEGAKLRVAVEQYHTLTCPDAVSLRRVLNRLPAFAGAVLDPPNLIPVASYPKRDQMLRDMFHTLKGRVAVVHLKDFLLAPGETRYKLPGSLQGALNYPQFVAGILKLPATTPLFAEHIGPAEFAGTRAKLLELFRAAA